ncbi:Bromodomain-containing protein, partial [Gorgonomyces haynaldii]
FSVPVDPQLVPDYHTVINTPMDLGTMFEKASNGDYNGMDDVKNDFVQVITNAKLYNRPDTVYYKEAERL